MNRKLITTGTITIIVIASIIFLSGSEVLKPRSEDTIPVADDSNATPEGISSVVDANNQFALDFYSELKDEEGNIFFSPYSISVTLAMTYEGARGQTAEEIQSVMHFPEDNSIRRPAFAWIHNQLNKKNKDYTLNTANALWAQEEYEFLDEYFDTIERYYVGKAANLDFVGEAENSRERINDWVEDRTNDKIKDLIPQGYINEKTRLVLTNAIYFKGKWAKQFDEIDTQERDFRISSEITVKVQMMYMRSEEFNYTETHELQILEMIYEGGEISMLILLPKGDNLDSLEASISPENITEWRNDLREERMIIYIPKFKLETKYFMKDILSEMGMPTAFSSDKADFSGMDGSKNLYIGHVIHQAFIEVNEKGTEAAAATLVVEDCSGPALFLADHPFIFLIQDRETGNILFLGRVVDPTE